MHEIEGIAKDPFVLTSRVYKPGPSHTPVDNRLNRCAASLDIRAIGNRGCRVDETH